MSYAPGDVLYSAATDATVRLLERASEQVYGAPCWWVERPGTGGQRWILAEAALDEWYEPLPSSDAGYVGSHRSG